MIVETRRLTAKGNDDDDDEEEEEEEPQECCFTHALIRNCWRHV
jgi:hypothetical protein